jgi:xylitol oxidase
LEQTLLFNWARNQVFNPEFSLKPKSISELQEIVRYFPKIRAFGTLGTFNEFTGSNGVMISLDSVEFDASLSKIDNPLNFSAGITFVNMVTVLSEFSLAIDNTPSLLDLNVVGSILTGTHGSGIHSKILASNIQDMNFVSGTGEYLLCDKRSSDFPIESLGVSLGLLGIVTNFSLITQPEYMMFQQLFSGSTKELLFEKFDDISLLNSSSSIYTKFDMNSSSQILVKSRVSETGRALKNFLAAFKDREIHDSRNLGKSIAEDTSSTTLRNGIILPWYQILPHTKPGLISSGDELQSEFFFDVSKSSEVLDFFVSQYHLLKPILRSAEIRFTSRDDFWISPSFGRNSMVVHLTWRNSDSQVRELLSLIEKTLVQLGGRPHWGKIFTPNLYDFRNVYPKFDEFLQLRRILDPFNKFINVSLGQIFK